MWPAGVSPYGSRAEGQNKFRLGETAREDGCIPPPGVPKKRTKSFGQAIRPDGSQVFFAIQQAGEVLLQCGTGGILPGINIFNLPALAGNAGQFTHPIAVITIIEQITDIGYLQVNTRMVVGEAQKRVFIFGFTLRIAQSPSLKFDQGQQELGVKTVIFGVICDHAGCVTIFALNNRSIIFKPTGGHFEEGLQVKILAVRSIHKSCIRQHLKAGAPKRLVIDGHFHREPRRQCGCIWGYLWVGEADFRLAGPKAHSQQRKGISALGNVIDQRTRLVHRALIERCRAGQSFNSCFAAGRDDIGRARTTAGTHQSKDQQEKSA